MVTSAWFDVLDLLKSNTFMVSDEEGEQEDCSKVVELLEKIPNRLHNSSSLRWAVCASDSNRLELQLQLLPAPTPILTSKPAFKR